jgi:hypothetical protein
LAFTGPYPTTFSGNTGAMVVSHTTFSPYFSHYFCMIGQICDETRLLFADAVRRGIWRCESA